MAKEAVGMGDLGEFEGPPGSATGEPEGGAPPVAPGLGSGLGEAPTIASAAESVDAPPPLIYGPPYPEPASHHGPSKRLLVVGLAAVVVVAAVVIGVVTTTSSTKIPGAGVAPAAFVVSSTQNTLAQRTADLTISGTFSGKGITVPMTGTGFADFDTNSFSADATMKEASSTIDMKELEAGGKFLMGITVDGTNVPQFLTGDEWVDIPVPDEQASSLGAAGDVDPLSRLQLLAKKGATVVPLGTSQVDGVTVSGFAVTPSQQEEQQALQEEISAGHLTQSEAAQLLKEKVVIGNLTSRVYFDGSGLLRREVDNISGGSSGAIGKVTVDYQNFGTPVNIVLPPNSDIVSFSNFMQRDQQEARASGNSGNSGNTGNSGS